MMLKAKQKGFTLLELLVVITLLAILSVGALVAYDGLTEKAQASATANNTASVDRAIRQYKVISQKFPDQWDNLGASGAAVTTGTVSLADVTKSWLVNFPVTGAVGDSVAAALEAAGVEELQVAPDTIFAGVVPNLQHNEGATSGASDEVDVDAVNNLAIVAAEGLGTKFTGSAATAADTLKLNKLNDAFEEDETNMVVALGFGHDAAHSTAGSKVAIAQAATYTSANIDASKNYARYIGLFLVGSSTGEAATPADLVYRDKALFVGIVDPEGNGIDDNIAAAVSVDN